MAENRKTLESFAGSIGSKHVTDDGEFDSKALLRELSVKGVDGDLSKAIQKMMSEYCENVRKIIACRKVVMTYTTDIADLRKNVVPKSMKKFRAPFVCPEWDEDLDVWDDICIRIPAKSTFRQASDILYNSYHAAQKKTISMSVEERRIANLALITAF